MAALDEEMNTTERALSGNSPSAASILRHTAWVRKKAPRVLTAKSTS